MDPKEFGEYIRNLRKVKRLTLEQLKDLSGVSQPYLSQIENGEAGGIPAPYILEKLAKPLGVDYMVLMINAGYLDYNANEQQPNIKDEYLLDVFRATYSELEDFSVRIDSMKHVIGKFIDKRE